MTTFRKKTMPDSCVKIHSTLRGNLRRLMDDFNNEGKEQKGIGIIRMAKRAGLGVGSVQSILSDPHHSPSLRVLTQLATALDVSVSDLLQDAEA
ncbi:MAG: helix-turn-helix transcriptional regulator [Candidatus Delongbacteria bacterium]